LHPVQKSVDDLIFGHPIATGMSGQSDAVPHDWFGESSDV
jgi:hypothetical protein